MNLRVLAAVGGIAVVAVLAILLLPGKDKAPTGPGDASSTSTPNNATSGAMPAWHGIQSRIQGFGSSVVSQSDCLTCHWNPDLKLWRATWDRAPGNQWNLTVASAFPQPALAWVQADTAPPPEPTEQTATTYPVRDGESWQVPIDVPAGTTALVVELDAIPSAATDPTAEALRNQTGATLGNTNFGAEAWNTPTFDVQVALKGPSGDLALMGPEPQRKFLTVEAPAAGTWTLTATLQHGSLRGAPVPARLVATINFLTGPARGTVASLAWQVGAGMTARDNATFTFPATTDGGPPTVTVRARAYHDHAAFYQPDSSDIRDYQGQVSPLRGPEPGPPTYPREAIKAFWGSEDHYDLYDAPAAKSRYYAYTTDAAGAITGTGASPYDFTQPAVRGLRPGAQSLEFHVTWSPPVSLPNLGLRFSPANTPQFYTATLLNSAAGEALFNAVVDPAWWDPNPDLVRGWDATANLVLAPSNQYFGLYQFTTQITAYR